MIIGLLVKTNENTVLQLRKMCTNNIYVQLIRVRSRYDFLKRLKLIETSHSGK